MYELKKYLPKRLVLPEGTFNFAQQTAIDTSHQKLLEQIQACIDQLFLTTASGNYLVELGEQSGFVMPANSGLDIRAYRILVPLMVSAPKQIRLTIQQIIAAFYGTDRTQPSIRASVAEPYSLVDGDNIVIKTEKETVNLSVLGNQVSDINNASAAELAAIFNSLQSTVYADTVTDRSTSRKFLRFSDTTVGASANLRVIGGTIQNVLKFPNLIETTQQAGTNWIVTKTQTYTDVTKIQWDGVGLNPKMYLVRSGDIVTIRGLLSGLNHADLLNGSYEIIDSGYDYFVIRNEKFDLTSANVTQVNDNDFVFTSQTKITLYDNPEYGLTSETDIDQATVTVPAIPPLTRRFLSGSAHLHGAELNVLSFTRNNIIVSLPLGTDKPIGLNHFVIKNDHMMYDFCQPFYKTINVTDDPNPIYSVESGDLSFSALPPTTPTNLQPNPLHLEVGSSDLQIKFPFISGILNGWGFTINNADCTGIGNITSSIINTEHVARQSDSLNGILCTLRDTNGFPLIFSGVSFGPFNIHRYPIALQDGSDFYLEFPDIPSVVASGLEVGMTFQIDPVGGTEVNAFYSSRIKHRILYVNSIDNNVVNIGTGFGAGLPGLITTNAMGLRSTDFGGSAVSYFFDLTSTWNTTNVMSGLKLCMVDYSPSSNPAYVGSFIFDPQGVNTLFTVSKFITRVTQPILKGSNFGIIFVDKVKDVFGTEDFPSSGSILLDYGTDNIEGPINYIAVISSDTGPSQILIDPAYRFKKTHLNGAQVQYIHANTPYVPKTDGSDYPVYVTGSAQSRDTLFILLEELIAGGVFLQHDVLLPQLRYQDSAIPPFV